MKKFFPKIYSSFNTLNPGSSQFAQITCLFIYSPIHIFCKIISRFYYVLSIMLVIEDKIILEKMFEKTKETTFSNTWQQAPLIHQAPVLELEQIKAFVS